MHTSCLHPTLSPSPSWSFPGFAMSQGNWTPTFGGYGPGVLKRDKNKSTISLATGNNSCYMVSFSEAGRAELVKCQWFLSKHWFTCAESMVAEHCHLIQCYSYSVISPCCVWGLHDLTFRLWENFMKNHTLYFRLSRCVRCRTQRLAFGEQKGFIELNQSRETNKLGSETEGKDIGRQGEQCQWPDWGW